MTLRPLHTGMTVSDLERSVAFYRDALGLEVVMKQEKKGGYLAAIVGYAEAEIRMAQLETPDGGHRLELFEYVSPAGERTARETSDVGITHVCFSCDDVQAAYERAVAAGAEPVSPPVPIDSGANKGGIGVYLRDPDSITFELFQATA